MKEYKIIRKKNWCNALAECYPDLSEEAAMRPAELLEMGYEYGELIPRREKVYLQCKVKKDGDVYKVFTCSKCGEEFLGVVDRLSHDPFNYRVRVDGGQFIRIVEGNYRDKKEEVFIPYSFVLEERPLDK